MRLHETTHPWLRFMVRLDAATAPPDLWMLLGEAASKCDHIAGVPLKPETADRLHKLYLAKGVRATTAIEGNSLSEEEVIGRLDGSLHLPPSKEYLGKEIAQFETTQSISENPFFSFAVRAVEPGALTVTFFDTHGSKFEGSADLKVVA